MAEGSTGFTAGAAFFMEKRMDCFMAKKCYTILKDLPAYINDVCGFLCCTQNEKQE